MERKDRLQLILQQGTRLSLSLAVPVCIGLIIMADRLIAAWVGPGFSESVLVARVLLAAVLCRVGAASASRILKGATHPRFNALANAATGVVYILLSIALIRRFGLPGVAVATFVPVGFAATFVLFPSACRRVELPVAVAIRQAVWPAMWPAAISAAVLLAARGYTPAGLLPTACLLAIACLIYEALFFGLAISPEERTFYRRKALLLVGSYRNLPAAA